MPYVRASRNGVVASTVFIDWPQALDTGLRQLAREALSEPCVSSVELTDDGRARILWEEKDPDDLAAELQAEARERAAEQAEHLAERAPGR